MLRRNSANDMPAMDSMGGGGKKSVSKQLILVLILVLGAGGAYVGGFLDPVLQMVGLAGDSAQPRTRTRSAGAPVPATVNSGTVLGTPFTMNAAIYEGGALRLIQGPAANPAREIRIVLPLQNRWETPKAGNNFTAKTRLEGATPEILIYAGGVQEKSVKDGYNLNLRFGAIKDDQISGNVNVSLGPQDKTSFSGNFSASMQGFRTIDGKPVLTSDADETLMYVALVHLVTKGDKDIKDVKYRNASFSMAQGGIKAGGSLEVEYRIGKKTLTKNFDFEKQPDGWAVTNVTDI